MGITRTKTGALTLIAVSPALLEEVLAPLAKTIEECLQADEIRLLLDLREVTAVDSRGLEFLLETRDTVAARGGTLRLLSPTPLVAEVLAVTRLDRQLEITAELEKSVRSLV